MLTIISNFFLYIGSFQLALVGFMLCVLAFPSNKTPSILTSKKLRQILIEDYKQHRVKMGGLLGLNIILLKSGLICLVVGGCLWLINLIVSSL